MSFNKVLSVFKIQQHYNAKYFFNFNSQAFKKILENNTDKFWQTKGQTKALQLFNKAATTIPAYKDFLKKNQFNPAKVKTIKDFTKIPVTTKTNYLNKYSLKEKMWDGKIASGGVMAISSGTSGQSRIWPRSNVQELEAAVIHELLYSTFFNIGKYSTLLIIGLPLGIYVSGIATTLPSWLISNKKKYNLTIASVGNKKEELINLIKTVGKNYDQVIIAGHPFFIKDAVEDFTLINKRKSKMKIKFLFTSQGFSETWRKYVLSITNQQYVAHDAINLYGSTDALLTAYETPLSIYIKNFAENNITFRQALMINLGVSLFQYNPYLRFLESPNDKLLITSSSGIPLLRFEVGDRGRLIGYHEMIQLLLKFQPNYIKDLKLNGWKYKSWKLPFFVLLGRINYSVDFHVANIRPEYISYALDRSKYYTKFTGKFCIHKYENKKSDTKLEINIELRKNVKMTNSIKKELKETIIQILRANDYRYDFLYTTQRKLSKINIIFRPYQHEKFFKAGVKPKYIQ